MKFNHENVIMDRKEGYVYICVYMYTSGYGTCPDINTYTHILFIPNLIAEDLIPLIQSY